MSVQSILLNTNSNQRGIYDAQLHSCQVYKTPVLPTDAVPLSFTQPPQPPLPPFEAVVTVGLQDQNPRVNYKTRVGDNSKNYLLSEWGCMVVGFQCANNETQTYQCAFPSNTGPSGVSDGYWYVAVSRSLAGFPVPDPPQQYDIIYTLMTRKIYELTL